MKAHENKKQLRVAVPSPVSFPALDSDALAHSGRRWTLSASLSLYVGLIATNPNFAAFITKRGADPRYGNLKLRAWLLSIIQRYPQYLLLLNDDSEHAPLITAHTLVPKSTLPLSPWIYKGHIELVDIDVAIPPALETNQDYRLMAILTAANTNSTLTSSAPTNHPRRPLQELPHLPEDDDENPSLFVSVVHSRPYSVLILCATLQ